MHVVKTANDTTRLRFWYDWAGRIVKKNVNGEVALFLWKGSDLFAEMHGSNGEYAGQYSYSGTDGLHAFIAPGGTVYYAHTDGIGNVIALSQDDSGAPDRTYRYDEWGQLVAGSDNASFQNRDRARWKGALMMAPEVGFGGFYYMRNRWYEPYTGRFLSEDPIGLAGGINLFQFVNNNPANAIDPTGTICEMVGPDHLRCDGLGTGWGADFATIGGFLSGTFDDLVSWSFGEGGVAQDPIRVYQITSDRLKGCPFSRGGIATGPAYDQESGEVGSQTADWFIRLPLSLHQLDHVLSSEGNRHYFGHVTTEVRFPSRILGYHDHIHGHLDCATGVGNFVRYQP